MPSRDIKLRTKIVDDASESLKAVRDRIKSTGEKKKEVGVVKDAFSVFSREAKAILVPTLGSIGLTSAGVVASLSAVTAGLRNYATGSMYMGNFARHVGMTTRSVESYVRVADRMGSSHKEARAALHALTDNLYGLEKRSGSPVYEGLVRHGAYPLAEELRKAVAGNDMEGAVRLVQGYYDQLESPLKKREFSRLMVGDLYLDKMGLKEWQKVMRDLKPSVDADQVATKKFFLLMLDFDDSMTHVKRTIGNALLPTFVKLTRQFEVFARGPAGKELNEVLRSMGRELKTVNWKAFGSNMRASAKDIIWLWERYKDLKKGIARVQQYNFGGIPGMPGTGSKENRQMLQALFPPEKGGVWFGILGIEHALLGMMLGTRKDLKEPSRFDAEWNEDKKLLDSVKREKLSLEALGRVAEEYARARGFLPGGRTDGRGLGGGYGGSRFGGSSGAGYGRRGLSARTGAGPGGGGSGRGGGGEGGPAGAATGPVSSRIAIAKRAFMDQLRKEGVPEQNLEEAANLLTGQALAESTLNPRATHDNGTGYGIYGARLERRSAMLAWLKANGYPADSLEGQSKFMAHEAMTKYGPTKRVLMGADPANRTANTDAITRNFESPAVINPRVGWVNQSARTRAQEDEQAAATWPKVLPPKQHDSARRVDAAIAAKTSGPEASADLSVNFKNVPPGTSVNAGAGGVFKRAKIKTSKKLGDGLGAVP
jgi:Phage tail lysozyme